MDDVRVAILGPPEVRCGGETVPVVGLRAHSLLALLALAVPQAVSDDRLIEEIWGVERPRNPTNALQALVSHVRRLLGRDVVDRRGQGYVLRLDPDAVDAVRLERLVDEAGAASARSDHATAAERYRAAVGLVRGPPLAELLDSWFAREAVVRLDELVLAAREGLIDCELTLGRHSEVVADLVDLVARYPLHERFRAQLVIALYRGGRQGDALQAYRDARDHLVEELGLDPGPELQALERAVLAHDPALAAPIVLTATATVRPSLPAPLTSFIGRRDELAMLASEPARLTTIVGAGGVGKTRLALEFAQRAADGGEVWFVELAPVIDPAAVAEAIASGVGAPERAAADGPPPTPEQRFVERLGGRRALVVLDNCEHVVSAAATCAVTLLAGCPELRVVATSRTPLGIEGERQLTLAPLDDTDSSALFVDRARAVQPLFAAGGDEERAELTELCRHLDGLPLAIELAAARAKTLPVPEIAERLRDRFRLLRRTQTAGTSRHDGLEAAIGWSYDLLFEEEQRMFRRLSVFAGGVTIDAAEQVCGPDAYELLSRLVDRSLLTADTTGRAVRFDMLESLRAYGMRRLEDAGELDVARADHLRWCTELAERVDHESRGADQLAWLARLDDEHDNVRAALSYAMERDADMAMRLLGSLLLPWWYRGRRHETRRWLAQAADVGRDAAPLLRARVLALGGILAEPASRRRFDDGTGDELHHELALAEANQREALAITRAADDARLTALAEVLLLNTLLRKASVGEPIDRDEAAQLGADAARLYDGIGDDHGSAVVRLTEAMLAVADGDLDHAVAMVEAARPAARRSGDRFSASRIEYLLGMVADLRGDVRTAYRHIEQSLRLFDQLGIREGVTAQARLLAPLAERGGEAELAAQWRAFLNDRDEGWTHYDGTVMASAQNHEGVRAFGAGDLERAAAAHTSALEWFQTAGLHGETAYTRSCLGRIASVRGDRTGAVEHHLAALDAAGRADDPSVLALALEGCASVAADGSAAATLVGAASQLRSGAALDVTALMSRARRAVSAQGESTRR